MVKQYAQFSILYEYKIFKTITTWRYSPSNVFHLFYLLCYFNLSKQYVNRIYSNFYLFIWTLHNVRFQCSLPSFKLQLKNKTSTSQTRSYWNLYYDCRNFYSNMYACTSTRKWKQTFNYSLDTCFYWNCSIYFFYKNYTIIF